MYAAARVDLGPAWIGLAGAAIGALAALLGAWLTARVHNAAEDERRRRDEKIEAYNNATRYLFRFAYRRTAAKIGEDGDWVMTVVFENQRDTFDDLVEAYSWVSVLAARCGPGYRARIIDASERLGEAVNRLMNATTNASDALAEVKAATNHAATVVIDCSRVDL